MCLLFTVSQARGASPAAGFLIFMVCFCWKFVRLRPGKNVVNALLVLSCPCRKINSVLAHPTGSSLQCQALPCSIALSASEWRSNGVAKERRFHAKTCSSCLTCASGLALNLYEGDF